MVQMIEIMINLVIMMAQRKVFQKEDLKFMEQMMLMIMGLVIKMVHMMAMIIKLFKIDGICDCFSYRLILNDGIDEGFYDGLIDKYDTNDGIDDKLSYDDGTNEGVVEGIFDND